MFEQNTYEILFVHLSESLYVGDGQFLNIEMGGWRDGQTDHNKSISSTS